MTPKSGFKTSEFWTTVLTAALSLVATVATANGWAFDTTKLTELVPVAATIMAGVVAAVYSHGRVQVKVAAIQAKPSIVTNVTTSGGPAGTSTWLTGSGFVPTPEASDNGEHVVAAAGDGAGEVVDAEAGPVAGAPADPPVPAALPAATPPVAPADPPEAPVDPDIPPLFGV